MIAPVIARGVILRAVVVCSLCLPGLEGGALEPETWQPLRVAEAPAKGRLERPAARSPRETPPSALPDPRSLRRRGARPVADAFGVRNWDPPVRLSAPERAAAEVPETPPPPPPPQAPPLPFRYLGMLGEQEEQTIVFLERQDKSYAVRPGDLIDGTYRVEEAGEGHVVFTYLPLDLKQVLTETSGH